MLKFYVLHAWILIWRWRVVALSFGKRYRQSLFQLFVNFTELLRVRLLLTCAPTTLYRTYVSLVDMILSAYRISVAVLRLLVCQSVLVTKESCTRHMQSRLSQLQNGQVLIYLRYYFRFLRLKLILLAASNSLHQQIVTQAPSTSPTASCSLVIGL